MALDFPNAPTNGQSFTAPNGVIWTWDGVKWVNGTGVATYAPIGSPAFTGDPTAPTPAYGDNDTSVATTAFVQAAVAPMTHNVGRNLIHNPLFTVWQRGSGPFTLSGNYTADRWQQSFANGSQSVTAAAIVDASRAQIGDEEASWALANAFVGSATAGSYNLIWQQIEDVHRLAGKSVVVSFYAAALAGTPKLGVSFDQNFGTGGSPSAPVYANGSAVTLSTAWTRYSVPLTLASMAGKTLGSNYDSKTTLILWHSAEAAFAARSGGVGVQSGTVFVWGVQLEVGSVATPLEKPDSQQDFAKCQRFFQTGWIGSYGNGTTGVSLGYVGQFSVPMRAGATCNVLTPTVSNCGTPAMSAFGPSSYSATAIVTATGYCSWWANFSASADL